MNFKPSNNFLKKLALQAKEKMLGLKDHKIAYNLVRTGAVGTTLIVTTAGSVVLAERMIPKNPSMNLELELVPDSTENTTTSVIEQAVTEALTQNTTEEPTYTTTIKPTENITEPVVTTIPVYTETDIVATETTTYYVDPTTNTVKTTTTTRQPSTQATTTKKQTTATTPKQTTKATTTTTQPVTQPSTEPSTKFEYKLEDITTNISAFYHFSNCLREDLLKNNGFYMDYGITYGGYEVYMVLTILNDGKISEDVIKKVFKDYSVEEIKNSIKFLYSIHEIEKYYGTRIDYSKYTLNKEIGNYINKISYHKYNGGYEDFMYDTFMLGVDANIVINNTPVAAFMATYDSENKYMGKENANEMGVDEFVNNVTQIALGKSYRK